MQFFTLIWRNLSRRRSRTLLTLSGVAVAVVAVVTLVGIADGLQSSLLRLLEERGLDLIVMRAGSARQSNAVISESVVDQIRNMDNVLRVTGTLFDAVSLHEENQLGITLQGYAHDSFFVDQLRMVEGPVPKPWPKRGILLGKQLAQSLGAKVGDEIEVLEDEPFRVVGIYESYNVFENGSMVMELSEMQELLGRQGDVSLIAIVAERQDAAHIEQLRQEIQSKIKGVEVTPAREYVENSPELAMARSAAWLTSTVALIIGTIGTLNTMIMSVYDRTREFGVLRAIGWRRWRVLQLVLAESMLIGLGGAVVGTVLGVVIIQLLSRSPTAGRIVSGTVDLDVIATGFVIAVAVGILGGLYPAIRASRLHPTEALRHE